MSKSFNTQIPSVFSGGLALPRHARCALSRLHCNRHSLLLSSYLTRIGRTMNSSCSACEHPSQDTYHLILRSPATNTWRRLLFGDSLLSTTSGPGSGEFPGFWDSMVFHNAQILRKNRVATTTTARQLINALFGLIKKCFLR